MKLRKVRVRETFTRIRQPSNIIQAGFLMMNPMATWRRLHALTPLLRGSGRVVCDKW